MVHFIAAEIQLTGSAYYPLFLLAVGIAVVIGGIMLLRVNAFLALLAAAIVVSLLAPELLIDDVVTRTSPGDRITRVAVAFGVAASKIGILIALAAVIGKAMMDSGAADRIVRGFLAVLGEKRGGVAMTASGFTLGIPVFFDTVFYLLVPLARSMYRRTGHGYLKYLMAIAAGGAVTHTLVPPTPGPLAAALAFGVDVGTMIFVAVLVGIPTATVGLLFAGWLDRRMPIPMRPPAGADEDYEEQQAAAEGMALPPLWLAVLPILLPLILIGAKTLTDTMVKSRTAEGLAPGGWGEAARWAELFGDPNLALLLATIIAVTTWWWMRRPTRQQMSGSIEEALMSGGLIILITAAGGAFGAMLSLSGVAPAIQQVFGFQASGLGLLFLAFAITGLIRFAQGSSTTAILVTSAMIASLLGVEENTPDKAQVFAKIIGYHPVYLAVAIGGGSLILSWMNDSGFWIFSKLGGLTEAETLKSWSPLLTILGCTAFLVACILAMILPMV